MLLGGSAAYFIRGILPTLLHRVNPLYAAQTIEQNKPSVRNSLINFLLLRNERDQVPRAVYQALEYRAAGDLTTIPADTVVDRINVIRLGYVFVAVLVLAAIYLLVSPKNPIPSAARFLLPWATIDAPTRVVFSDVQPKDHRAFHGDRVTISAEVAGLAEGEPVRMFYTTADRQSVDSAVTMALPQGGYKYECVFPPDELGLQQDLTYFLAAGDAKTRVYSITVHVAPTIRVKSTELEYPTYTGLKSRVFEDLGDVRALEGTRVVVTGEANLPVKSAEIDLDCTGRQMIRMDVKDQTAVGSFTIRPNPTDPRRPGHTSYQLRFVDTDGNQNRRPIRHQIEMVLDLPPRVSFVDGPGQPIQVPADAKVEFTISAEDPDFALRRVAFVAQKGGRSLPIRPILEKKSPEKPHAGPFEDKYQFSPADFDLNPGDEIVYYAVAEDNKEPVPNRARTEQNTILIVDPQGNQDAGEQLQDQPQEGTGPDQRDPEQPQDQDQKPQEEGQESQEGEGESESESKNKSENTEGGQGESGMEESGENQEQPGREETAQEGSESEKQEAQKPKPGEEADPSKSGREQQEASRDGEESQAEEGTQPQEGERQTQDQQGEGSAGGPAQGEDRTADPADSQDRQQDPSAKPGEATRPSEPIDGESNPGDAFEEILKHRQESPNEQEGGDPRQDPTMGSRDPSQAQGEQTEKKPSDAEQGKVDGESPGTTRDPDQEQAPEPRTGEEEGAPEEVKQERGDPGESGAEKGDRGGENVEKKDDLETEATPDPARQEGKGDNRGDDPSVDKGTKEDPADSGGDEGEEDPNRQKRVGDASTGEADRERHEAKDENDSSATGDTSGDRSGEAEEGGGMRSNQEGAGAAGQSEPSDAGGSKSEEKGDGETGARGGDQAESDRQPSEGQGEKIEGEGSGTKSSPAAQSGSRDQQGEPSDPSQSEGQGDAGQQPGGATSADPSGGRGMTRQPGGSRPGDPDSLPPEAEDVADAANREYSDKAVNLALEHLKDQIAKEEPELLDRLGWSKEDANRFLENWRKMQSEARSDPDGATKWEKALESLGLRPKRTSLQGGRTPTDQLRRLRDAGRFEPPPEWAEQFRAYTEGASGTSHSGTD